MINYRDFLIATYPFLIKIDAASYDPYDDFTKKTFFEMTHSVFAYQYKITPKYNEHHRYGFTLHCYRKINHIELIPKKYPVIIEIDREEKSFSKSDFEDKIIIFKSFCDGIHWLSGDIETAEYEKVKFSKCDIDIADLKTGKSFTKYNHNSLIINSEIVEYEYVVEDFDEIEHKYFKPDNYI